MKKYMKYLFEVIAIVIGITLSFLVDEWREDNQNRDQLESNLKALRYELIKDGQNADQIVNYYDSVSHIYSFLFNEFEKTQFNSMGQMQIVWNNLTDLGVKFRGNSNTYSALIELNLFKHLKNDSILLHLNDYYGHWKVLLTDYEDWLKNRLEVNRGILDKSLRSDMAIIASLKGDEDAIAKALIELNGDFHTIMQIQEFRNNNVAQMMMYGYLKDLFIRYRKQNETLIGLIDEEIGI